MILVTAPFPPFRHDRCILLDAEFLMVMKGLAVIAIFLFAV